MVDSQLVAGTDVRHSVVGIPVVSDGTLAAAGSWDGVGSWPGVGCWVCGHHMAAGGGCWVAGSSSQCTSLCACNCSQACVRMQVI